MFTYRFASMNQFREWLRVKSFNCGSPEAFDLWLNEFFDDGNEFDVGYGHWHPDYFDCIELV